MAISKANRDRLLVEARHRCTVCAEKCFEIHHIEEQSEGGSDEPDNLIVLCPNCHQHRYHRSKEFTKDQLRLYKQKLKEQNEIERRLLLNLDEIQRTIKEIPVDESERALKAEINEAARLVSQDKSPELFRQVQETSNWLAERELIRLGARKAIEVEWDLRIQREQEKCQAPKIISIDENGWEKASDFPEAYKLVFILDHTPSAEWSRLFERTYEQSWNFHKRRTYISGNRIYMIVASSDNIQEHTDYAKQLISETDQHVQTVVFPRVKAKLEQGKQAALTEFDTIQSLKLKIKDIKL